MTRHRYTLLVNLYGAPGAGKSTMAARLFVMLKDIDCNAELAREYVKTWAYEGKVPDDHDQMYITAKQAKIERVLYGNVQVILCDAPLEQGALYEEYYTGASTVRPFITKLRQDHPNVRVLNVLVHRTKAFTGGGRFCSESGSERFAKYLDQSLPASVLAVTGDAPGSLRVLRAIQGVCLAVAALEVSDGDV